MEKIVKLKKCSCGKDLKTTDIQYIGKMESPKTDKVIHLFNCKHCKTTMSLKIAG